MNSIGVRADCTSQRKDSIQLGTDTSPRTLRDPCARLLEKRSMGVFDAPLRRLGQELRGLRVRFVAVTQGIDTDESNPNSRLMLNLLAAFAEFERELILKGYGRGWRV